MAGRRTRILKRRSNTIGITGVVFVLGIALPLWFPKLSEIPYLFLFPVVATLACVVAVFRYRKNIHTSIWPWLVIWLLALSLGVFRSSHTLTLFIQAPDSIRVTETSTVTSWQERRYATYSFGTVNATAPTIPGKRIAITAPIFPPLRSGDRIYFECDATKMILKYAAYGSWYECKKPTVLSRTNESPQWLLKALNAPVQSLSRAITKTIPEPAGSFTSGILLGADDVIPIKIKDDFRVTGTAHIFALSGFNITLIASCLAALLAYFALSTRNRFILAVSMIGFFIIATGAESSSVRAGIMGAIILLGRHSGRIARTRILIPLAASAMLLHNPLILRYDIGFQLSFLATMGIIALTPSLQERLRRIPNTFAFRDTAAATIAASIATAPLIVSLGNSIGWKNILANIIIGPLIPIAMVSGFMGTIVGAIVPPLSPFIGTIARIPAQTIIDTANVLAHW